MKLVSGQEHLKVTAGNKQMESGRRAKDKSQDLSSGTRETWSRWRSLCLTGTAGRNEIVMGNK
jgi:hypothetical protein